MIIASSGEPSLKLSTKSRTKFKKSTTTTTAAATKTRIHCQDVQESDPTSYSAESIGSNQDLINLIFTKLEPKHRQRCAIICKFWYEVITSRTFKYKLPPLSHLLLRWSATQSRQRSIFPAIKYSIVPLHNDQTSNRPPPQILFRPALEFLESNDQHVNGIRIIQSCNSLFLCSPDSSIKKLNKNGAEKNNGLFPSAGNVEHYVYNPGTNKFRTLPWPAVRRKTTREVIAMNLAFDPTKSPHYKVVSLSTVRNSCSSYNQVDIYSSEKWRWRATKAEFPPNWAHVDFTNGVFLNGGVHWASHTGDTSVYFDVENKHFKIMPMPPVQGGGQRRSIRYFGESGGRLLLIDSQEQSPVRFAVFRMKKSYSEWKVKYKVNMSSCFFNNGRILNKYHILSVICGVEKGDLLVIYSPGRDGKGLMTYSLRDDRPDKIHSSVPGWDSGLLEEKGYSVVHPLMSTKFEVL